MSKGFDIFFGRRERGDTFAFPFEEEEEEEEKSRFLSVRAKAGESSLLVRSGLLSPSAKTPARHDYRGHFSGRRRAKRFEKDDDDDDDEESRRFLDAFVARKRRQR